MKEKVEVTQRDTHDGAPEAAVARQGQPEVKRIPNKLPAEDLRPRHKKQYESGTIPVFHRCLYQAIRDLFPPGKTEGLIKLTDAMANAGISIIGAKSAMAALQHYGYLTTEKEYRTGGESGVGRAGTYVRILKDM